VKGHEGYVFLFDDENQSETLRTLGRYAVNPDLSFSWYDAAVLSQEIRQLAHRECVANSLISGSRKHIQRVIEEELASVRRSGLDLAWDHAPHIPPSHSTCPSSLINLISTVISSGTSL
jgi:hypothetical protein